MITLDNALTGAAFLLAVASPIITSLITAHTQKREREAVFYLQRRAEIFENYVKQTGRYLRYKNPENAAAYGAAYGEILLYLPAPLREAVSGLDARISIGVGADPGEIALFNAVCSRLSEYAPRIKGKKRSKIAK